MKRIRQIGFVFIIVIFLVPSTGIFFTRHTCKVASRTVIVLNRDYNCCEDAGTLHGISCCNTENRVHNISDRKGNTTGILRNGDSGTCCTTESLYLKEQDEYTNPVKARIPQHVIYLASVQFPLLPQCTFFNNDIYFLTHSPPVIFDPGEILQKNSVLLL